MLLILLAASILIQNVQKGLQVTGIHVYLSTVHFRPHPDYVHIDLSN